MASFKWLARLPWMLRITSRETLLSICRRSYSVGPSLFLHNKSFCNTKWNISKVKTFSTPPSMPCQARNLSDKPADLPKTTLTSRSQLQRLYDLARPEASSITGAISLLMVSSSVTLSVPFFMGRLVDMVQSASQSGSMHETLQPILFALCGVFVIGAFANMGRIFLLQVSGQRITKRLRTDVFSSIMKQEIAFFDVTRTGELINRLSSDVELVSGAVTQNISDGLRALAQVAAGIGMMFFMSTDLAKVVLTVVPPVTISAIVYGRYLRSYTKQTQDVLAQASQTAEEKISNIRTVRAFAKEPTECSLYLQHIERVFAIAKKESQARSVFFGLTGLAGNAIMLLVLYNGGIMMEAGQITVGDLSAFLLYSGYVAISISGLSNFYSSINKSLGASNRLWELTDRLPSIPLADGSTPQIDLSSSDIVFNDVTFSYPTRQGRTILNKLNFRIEAGKVTAVVGRSGSGKTTLGSLLLRFYEPGDGTVTIGGVDLTTINPQWLRTNIGAVSQDPALFSSSVGDNIAYGAADPTRVSISDIETAAREANAYDFISQLPHGFDTNVGERGITLSGGQRQRVAIARALLKNPKILLLDEATSSLDAESEYLVRDALERVSVGRTTITIAHRLSTVRGAHLIVVLGEDGKVTEQGSYQELIGINGGVFRQLVEKQTLLL